MPRVTMAVLDTFSVVGGIQNFNRRQINNLVGIAREHGWPEPRVCILRDDPRDVPASVATCVRASGPSWGGFVHAVLSAATGSDHLLLGHINLAPLACLAKTLNPRLKITLFVHGEEVWNLEGHRRRRFYEPFVMRCVDQIAAVSAHTANVMAREFRVAARKFLIFPNAVDAIHAVSRPSRSPDIVLAVARLEAGDRLKNVDALIRAVAILAQRGLPIRLEIVGDGALRTELECLASGLGVAQQVKFLGRVDDVTLNDAYDRAAVFALPSSQEGFGIVYLEAWRHGLPVICGMKGASHEIVSDGVDGLVSDETNAGDLADKIAFLIDNPKIASEFGQRGYQKVQQAYSNETARRNLAALLTLGRR